MGFSANNIAFVFAWQSLFIAGVGGALGVLLGGGVSYLQQIFGFIKVSADSTQAYPIVFSFTDAFIIFITILLLGLITAIYPWIKAYGIAKIKDTGN